MVWGPSRAALIAIVVSVVGAGVTSCSDSPEAPAGPTSSSSSGGTGASSSSSGAIGVDSGDDATTVFIGCCNGVCVDTNSSNEHCGACNSPCGSTEQCTNGTCLVRLEGNGADGAFAPTADTTINTHRAGATGAAGAKTVTVSDASGFAVGQVVLLHQSRGAGAGKWELATIASIDSGAKNLTMARALRNSYASAGNVDRAQAVIVEQYTTVNVPSGVTVRAPQWDGATGGILAFKATGTVSIAGALAMDGAGFRGVSHASQCAGGTRYFCSTQDTANGFYGESPSGPSGAGNGANGSGGGGGQDGQDCAAGGGGGYGGAGAKGTDGSTDGVCRAGAQLGGAPGGAAGDTNLGASILFGGAGGEGGADEDGAYPGKGGDGGGIIVIGAMSVAITGSVRANGATGTNGVVTDTCGGAGCGMGGGGGGAGGAVLVRASGNVDIGSSRVTATGGSGGVCSCTSVEPGGAGGVGRIGIGGGSVNGTSTPTFAPN